MAYGALADSWTNFSAPDRLIVVSNEYDTGFPGMGIIAEALIREAGLEAPKDVVTLGAEGCSGLISGFREAELFLNSNPDANVLVIANEISTPLFHNNSICAKLTDNMYSAQTLEQASAVAKMARGLMIQRYLFGDGTVAFNCVHDSSDKDGISVTKTKKWVNLDPQDRHILENLGTGTKGDIHSPIGYFYQQPKKLFERMASAYLPTAGEWLLKQNVVPTDIAIHTGSGPILDLVKNAFSLPEEMVKPSRDVLANRGNMNAATGAQIIHNLLQKTKSEGKNLGDIKLMSAFFGVGLMTQVAI